MAEVKGYLRQSMHMSDGVYASIYIDSVDDLGKMQTIVGCDKKALARGSVAYDKNQNVVVYDGEHWVKDGEAIPNMVKKFVIPEQSGRTKWVEDFEQYASEITVEGSLPTTLTVTFNGKEYEVTENNGTWGAAFSKEGVDWSEYPFVIVNDVDWYIVTESEMDYTINGYVLEEESEDSNIIVLMSTLDGEYSNVGMTASQIYNAVLNEDKMVFLTIHGLEKIGQASMPLFKVTETEADFADLSNSGAFYYVNADGDVSYYANAE